MWQLFAKLLIQ